MVSPQVVFTLLIFLVVILTFLFSFLIIITAPEQWTSIPLQVKIYKLLLSELLNAMESNVSQQASAGGEDLEEVHEVKS